MFSVDRLTNTTTSHVLFSFWSIVCDFLVAWGCAAIVLLFRRPAVAYWTYALVLFAPPLWWDSVIWGQMDAVILAPTVWMLYFMLRHRWLTAGILWGVAFSLKPQAILFIPLWGLVAIITLWRISMAQGSWRPIIGLALAPVVLFVIALPFTLHTPDPPIENHSSFEWFKLSYAENIPFLAEGEYDKFTTLKAFNLWYADLLITDINDAKTTWLGVEKNTWGLLFVLTALFASFALVLLRWRDDRRVLALYAGLSLLAFMIFPTQVHERYLVLALPFLGMMVALWWRFWPALLLLTIVSMAQITWPQWMNTKAGYSPTIIKQLTIAHEQAQARLPEGSKLEPLNVWSHPRMYQYRMGRAQTLGYEWTFTILALLGTLLTAAVFINLRPQPAAFPASTGPPSR